MKLAVTGPPGSGKTTLCGRLVDALDLTIGGIRTQEIRGTTGQRTGFAIRDIASGTEGTLASTDRDHGPRVGKYRVHVDDVERVAIPAIERAIDEADMIVIDEIAPMELTSNAFVTVAHSALEGDVPTLVTFKGRARHPLFDRIRELCEVYELTVSNREEIYAEIHERLSRLKES